MASITKINAPAYELQLTQEEAQVLYTLVCSTGGPPKGPRGHADKIFEALKSVGFRDTYPSEGSIWLTETT